MLRARLRTLTPSINTRRPRQHRRHSGINLVLKPPILLLQNPMRLTKLINSLQLFTRRITHVLQQRIPKNVVRIRHNPRINRLNIRTQRRHHPRLHLRMPLNNLIRPTRSPRRHRLIPMRRIAIQPPHFVFGHHLRNEIRHLVNGDFPLIHVLRTLPTTQKHLPTSRHLSNRQRRCITELRPIKTRSDKRPIRNRLVNLQALNLDHVKRLRTTLTPTVQPHSFQERLIRTRPIPLRRNLIKLARTKLPRRPRRFSNRPNALILDRQVMTAIISPVQIEQIRALNIARRDLQRLSMNILSNRTLPRLTSSPHIQRPRIIQRTLRQIRIHRLMRLQLTRQIQPVRLIETIHRRTSAITRTRRVRQRNSLTVLAATRIQPADTLFRHIKQIRVRTLRDDIRQRTKRQFLNLLNRNRKHRNVRRTDRPAHRIPVSIPTVEPRRPLRMQLTERQQRLLLRLSQTLTNRETNPLEPAAPLPRMPLRVHLVSPIDERPELRINHIRLTLQRPRAIDRALLNQRANLRTQRRPRLRIRTRNNKKHQLHGIQAATGIITRRRRRSSRLIGLTPLRPLGLRILSRLDLPLKSAPR